MNSRSPQNTFDVPADWYTSEHIFRLEKQKIFGRSWVYAGQLSQVSRPGDYFTCQIADTPIVVLRNEDNALTAFVNVCKHRGAEVIPFGCSGNRKSLQCHYHGWNYGLDGKLRAAPRSEKEPCFNKSEFLLTRVQAEAYGPFVFVNLDLQAQSFGKMFSQLSQLFLDAGIDLSQTRFRQRRTYEMQANWKVVVENYLECYHCPIAHKGLASLIDLEFYETHTYDYFSVQRGPQKQLPDLESGRASHSTSDSGLTSAGSAQTESREGLYCYLWPTFMINTYPGRPNASINIMIPVSPNKTIGIFDQYLDERFTEVEAQEMWKFIEEVQEEDRILVESVQRGMRSGYHKKNHLMTSKENGIQHFQGLLSGYMGVPESPSPSEALSPRLKTQGEAARLP